MDHYEYVRKLYNGGNYDEILRPELKDLGLRYDEDVKKFYSALLSACKETLAGGYEYDKLLDPRSAFYKVVETINVRTAAVLGQPVISSLVCHEIYHLVCFEQAGQKTYEVAPALGEALRDTELRGLTVDDLRFPYESVIIRVPHSTGFRVWGGTTGWHSTDCIYFTHGGARLCMMLVGNSKNGNPGDNAVFYADIAIPSQGAVPLEALKDDMDSRVRGIEGKEMLHEWGQQFDWAINTLLYITSENAVVEVLTEDREARSLERRLQKAKGTKREKISARLRTLNRRKIIYLGRGLEAKLVKEASGVRVRVRGHWHKYWTGKCRKTLITKWVQPYWRGEGKESNPIVRLTR